jgi:hypothetical protein
MDVATGPSIIRDRTTSEVVRKSMNRACVISCELCYVQELKGKTKRATIIPLQGATKKDKDLEHFSSPQRTQMQKQHSHGFPPS